MKNKWTLVFLVLSTIILVFTAIFFFVKPAFLKSFDLSGTGQIGDTIGGISAPIVGIVGFVLIYLSFREQYKANEIQRQALNDEITRSNNIRDIDLFFKVFSNFDQAYTSLLYRDKRGQEAMADLSNTATIFDSGHPPVKSFTESLNYVLHQLLYLYQFLEDNQFEHREEKLIKGILDNYYKIKINPYREDIINGLGEKHFCSNTLTTLNDIITDRSKFFN